MEGSTFVGGTLSNQKHGRRCPGDQHPLSGWQRRLAVKPLSRAVAIVSLAVLAGCATEPEKEAVVETELVVADKSDSSQAPSEQAQAVESDQAYLYSEMNATQSDNLSSSVDFDLEEGNVQLGGLESGIVAGDEPAAEPALGLDRALAEVWRSHPNVIRAQSEIEATGYDLSGAKTGFYPYLSVTAVEASNDASNTSLNIIQPIWSGGRVSAEVRQAEAEQNRALAQLNQTRLDLALQTAEAYLNVVLSEEQGMLWRRYITSLEELLRIIQNRADQGVSPPVDIQTAMTRLSQARAGLASSRAQLISSKNNLQSLLNQPIPELGWPGGRYHLSDYEINRIMTEEAISSHPAGQVALAEIAAQDAAVKISKASLFPSLSLQYRKQLAQESGDFTPDSSTRLVLEYTSSEGLRGFSSLRAVNQRLNAARQDLAFARRDVRDTISSAKAERDIALLQFDAQVDAAKSAVKLVGSFLRQFKVGRKAWLEVLNSHREAHEALLQISNIKRSYWSANIRLALQGMLWVRVNEDAPSTYLDLENE